MARQGGWVELEQSNMCHALNMAKMANGGFWRAATHETQQIIKKPRAKVCEVKTQGVEFPGHQKVKAAMQTHPAMVYNNHMAGSLPYHNGSVQNQQTGWRRKGTATPHS
jgi:hypothetical protein